MEFDDRRWFVAQGESRRIFLPNNGCQALACRRNTSNLAPAGAKRCNALAVTRGKKRNVVAFGLRWPWGPKNENLIPRASGAAMIDSSGGFPL